MFNSFRFVISLRGKFLFPGKCVTGKVADRFPHLTEIDGIDLSNYVRDPNSYNPVVYIHKRNLKRSNCFVEEQKKKSPEVRHIGQQFNFEEEYKHVYEVKEVKNDNYDPIMERTLQFAKRLIPLTIPLKDKDENVYYTIKSAKKSKIENKSCKCNCNRVKDEKFNKNKIKNGTKKAKTKTKRNISTTETISESSQNTNNTVDDTNNQSLSELSEMSDHSQLKKDTLGCIKEANQIIASESFEATRDQYPETGKIKVHIINDKEKDIFYESVRTPLVKAVKESVSQFCTNEIGKELNLVKAKIESYSSKLDNVLERLSKIEKKFNNRATDCKFSSDNVRTEKIERDMGATKADHCSDGESHASKRRREKTELIMSLHDVSDELGRDEKYSDSLKESSSCVGKKPVSTHRIPARFCWTDAKIN